MAKIILSESDGPYHCEIDTDAMTVEIKEAFLGVHFVTDAGEKLSVSMRDNGFEVHYTGDSGYIGFNAGRVIFNDGIIRGPNEQYERH